MDCMSGGLYPTSNDEGYAVWCVFSGLLQHAALLDVGCHHVVCKMMHEPMLTSCRGATRLPVRGYIPLPKVVESKQRNHLGAFHDCISRLVRN